jgi:hypothetical protein
MLDTEYWIKGAGFELLVLNAGCLMPLGQGRKSGSYCLFV